MTAEVASVLVDAANCIRADGWTARHERGGDRRFWDQAQTLIEAVEYVVPWNGRTPAKVFAELCRRAGTADLNAWNEEPGRTRDQVLALLEQSA
jgi:hypothetical protein